MSDRILVVGLVVLFWAFPSSLFGQAAAEYGALAGSSASITAKAGTALQHGVSRLVRRMPQTISRPSQATVRNGQRKRDTKLLNAAASVHTGSAGEMPIVSLVGDKDGCAGTSIKSSNPNRGNALRPRDCQREASNRKTQDKYPSAVSISFGH